MKDKLFLIWLHERLVKVHGESLYVDYMHKLRAIIQATPEDRETPNAGSDTNPINFYVSNLIQDNEIVAFSDICGTCGESIFSSRPCTSTAGHQPSGIVARNIKIHGGDHAHNDQK